MRRSILTMTALAAGVLSSSAAVSTWAWYHMGEAGSVLTDSSGNGRNFSSAYSHYPINNPAFGGNPNAVVVPGAGVGGPLAAASANYNSTTAARWGYYGTMLCTMWGVGGNPPAQNYFIEAWFLPHGKGFVGGSAIIFSSGTGGGAYELMAVDNGDGTSSLAGKIAGPGTFVGGSVPVDTNSWIHLAMVNNAGVTTFYTNGVPCGDSDTSGASAAPSGDIFVGNPNAYQGPDGLIDEARIVTFGAGEFSTNLFLLRPPGPTIVVQPQSTTVWENGPARFTIGAPIDASLTYQWQRGGSDIPGATGDTYYLPQVAQTDSGAQFRCILTEGSLSVTSQVATLTVATPVAADVNAYRSAVTGTASLIGFFPGDGDTGATLTDTKDSAFNGTLENGASYDGRTNSSFSQRAVYINTDDLVGDVQIPNNPAFEFSSGNGTIEALVMVERQMLFDQTIFAMAQDGVDPYYALGTTKDGNTLTFTAGTVGVSWPVAGGLGGRLHHVAIVIQAGNVTAYADGVNLGTKTAPAFGTPGGPGWIGTRATTKDAKNYRFSGSIDELAIYSAALDQNTVQTHYSKFAFGNAQVPPSISSQPSSKTLFAGGSPVLTIKASGTLPLNYQWKVGGANIPGATTPSLTLNQTTTASNGTYICSVSNPYGNQDTTPIQLTFTTATAGAYVDRILKDNPTGFWRLNEGSGPTAVDAVGFNDGTYAASGVTYGSPSFHGETGTAATFDGVAGNAVVPLTPVLNPSGPFSIELWVKPSAYAFVVPFCSMDRPGRSGGYEFYLDGNYPGFEFHTAAGGGYSAISGDNTAPTVGEWYHLVGTYDGSSNIYCFVNGQAASPDAFDSYLIEQSPPFAPNAVTAFVIGSRPDGLRYFPGSIADVAFYNYQLTAQQIRAHALIGQPPKLQMAAASGIVVDSKPSGTPHDGLNNGASWLASDGTHNGVMKFVGASANQITVAADPDFNSTSGTIMFWMRSAGTNGVGNEGAMLLDRRTTAGLCVVQNWDGTLFLQANPSGSLSTYSSAQISDNQWHHVAVTYGQKAGDFVYIYIDGVANGVTQSAADWSWPATQQIELGSSHDPYWAKYDGLLDDVRIYNRVLTAAEVASAMGGAEVDAASLKLRFNFDTAPVKGYLISWPSGSTLQNGPTVTGPWTDVPASPPYILIPTPANQFFRTKDLLP